MGANQSQTNYDNIYIGEGTSVYIPRNISGKRRESYIGKEIKNDRKKFQTG